MSYLLRCYIGDALNDIEIEPNTIYRVGNASKDVLSVPGLDVSFTIQVEESTWRGTSRDKRYRAALEDNANHPLGEISVLDRDKKIAVSVYRSGPDCSQCFDISNEDNLSIGRSESCDIILSDSQVSGHHLELFREGYNWRFQDNNSSNGTYINGKRADEGILSGDDVLTVGFCKIMVLGSNLTVITTCNISTNIERSRQIKGIESSEEAYPYQFKKSPRLREEIPTDVFELQSPPSIGGKPVVSWMNVLLPPILTVGVMLAICLLVTNTMTMLYFSVPMTVIGVIMSVIRYRGEKKRYLERQQLRIEKYDAYIDEETEKIERCLQEQRRIMVQDFPSVQQCLHLAEGPDRKFWDRKIKDADFLTIRIGLGSLPAAITIKYARRMLSMEEDALADRPTQISEKYQEVANCPIVIDLYNFPTCGIIGERQSCMALGKNIIVQATAHHSYDDLRVVVLCDTDEVNEWSFCRWLPHLFDDSRRQRLIADKPSIQNELLDMLEETLSQRETERLEGNSNARRSITISPYYLFVCASTMVGYHPIMRYLTANDPRLGVSAVFLFDRIEDLPKECLYIVDLSAKPNVVYQRDQASKKQTFIPDDLSQSKYEEYARLIAPLRIDGGDKFRLPNNISFLQGYRAQRPQMLNIEKYWEISAPEQGMSVPIGVCKTGELFLFDIYEKAHGPHGLVAGMTGSGKSEMVQTWILSMAVHFPPSSISFVLIDFKGTGLLLPFRNLPHLAGSISDLDTNIGRNLIALENELTRRKALLDQCNVSNISAYRKLLQKGQATEPLPYLFLVIDEFAEFKVQFPEFMQVINRVFAVGRTLGVHIILLTQKPASVVDDKMMANTRFRWCLKVANSSDSRDMLHHSDAAKITNPGRAFVQVGEDEIYEEIQSFWSGAPYNPYRNLTLQRSTKVSVVDLYGNRLCYEPEKTTGFRSEKNEIDAVVEYMDDYCRKKQVPRARTIWTKKIPNKIFLNEVLQIAFDGEKWGRFDSNLRVTVGLLDDPRSQSQYPLYFNLSDDGHVAIYGAPSTGKTTILHTAVMSLALSYPPDAVNMYLLDFGGGSMQLFRNLPHVGGVPMAESDEQVEKLVNLLDAELKTRRKEIAALGIVNIHSYCEMTGKRMPYVVLLVDNFAPALELYPELEGLFQSLTRDGAGCGMYLITTTGAPNTIPYRISQNIKTRVALRLTDKMDYAGIVGKTGGLEPEDVPGRGLMCGNPPLEFQTALPAEGNTEGERVAAIRSMIALMNEKWNGEQALNIPVMPDSVHMEKYPCEDIFIGLSYDEVKPVVVDLIQEQFLLISFASPNYSLMTALCQQAIEKLKPRTIVLADELPGIDSSVSQDFDQAIELLMPEMQRRKDATNGKEGIPQEEFPWILVLIPDLDVCFKRANNDTVRRLNSLIALGKGLHVAVIVQGKAADVGRLYNGGDPFINSMVKYSNAILSGGTIMEHTAFAVDLNFTEKIKPLDEGDGYLVTRERTIKLKLLQP